MSFVKHFVFAFIFVLGLSAFSYATNDCNFSINGTEMSLSNNCTTDQTIITPAGVTDLDLNGFTITGHDPAGGHFVGAVVQAGNSSVNITNGTITVSGLANVCDAGANRLRGIMFQGTSGSVSNVQVLNINQGPSGCQEGNAIEVRNFSDAVGTMHVTIDMCTLTGYQKTGVVANGAVDVSVTNSTVDGLGTVNYIARNGIQFGFGGTGRASKNTVNGNSYSGPSGDSSGGILIVGGEWYGGDYSIGVQVMNNTITNNDVGAWLSNLDANGSAPTVSTNIKVVNNNISNSGDPNTFYQAGVSDVGNNDKIINNTITGYAVNNTTIFKIDASTDFTNKPKVHANK